MTLSALRSADADIQRHAIESFASVGPEQFGAGARRVIATALDSEHSEVQRLALASLHRLAAVDRALADPPRFEATVTHLVMSADQQVSAQASAVVAALYSNSGSVAEVILSRALSEDDRQAKANYFRKLSPSHISSPHIQQALLQAARGSADIVSVEAATALLRVNNPPQELLPELIRLLQDRAFFGRRALVSGVARYGSTAATYTPLLERVRQTLQHEMTLDYTERSVNVSREGSVLNVDEDPDAMVALERTLAIINETTD